MGPSPNSSLSAVVMVWASTSQSSRLTSRLFSLQVRIAPFAQSSFTEVALRAEGSVMSATPQELEDSLFSDPSFDEKALRFATDSVCQVVYITRERFLDVDADEDGECFLLCRSSFRGRALRDSGH